MTYTTSHNAIEVARALFPGRRLISVTSQAGYAAYREQQGEESHPIGNGFYALLVPEGDRRDGEVILDLEAICYALVDTVAEGPDIAYCERCARLVLKQDRYWCQYCAIHSRPTVY